MGCFATFFSHLTHQGSRAGRGNVGATRPCPALLTKPFRKHLFSWMFASFVQMWKCPHMHVVSTDFDVSSLSKFTKYHSRKSRSSCVFISRCITCRKFPTVAGIRNRRGLQRAVSLFFYGHSLCSGLRDVRTHLCSAWTDAAPWAGCCILNLTCHRTIVAHYAHKVAALNPQSHLRHSASHAPACLQHSPQA